MVSRGQFFYTSDSWWSFTLVSSGPYDSSLVSSQSQQYCSQDGLDSSSNFQFFKSAFQTVLDRSKCTNYKLVSKVLIEIFTFFYFYSFLRYKCQIFLMKDSFLLVNEYQMKQSVQELVVCILKYPKNFIDLIFLEIFCENTISFRCLMAYQPL